MTQMKHLSIVDGAFLHMESAEMPMHVGSLNLFDAAGGLLAAKASTRRSRRTSPSACTWRRCSRASSR